LAEEKTRNREIKAMLKAMQELNLKKSLLITRDEFDEIKINDCLIQVVPVWYFLYEIK